MAEFQNHSYFPNGSITVNPNRTASIRDPIFRAWSDALVFIPLLFLNGALLSIFLTHKDLINPFVIYVMNLISTNLFCWCVCVLPLEALYYFSGSWWMGNFACDLYIYGIWLLPGVITYSHFSISLNRLWAICAPLKYRRYHSTRFAVCACMTLWMCMHILSLPAIIMDSTLYRVDSDTSCVFNVDAQKTWAEIYMPLIFYVPNVFVILSFPCTAILRICRNRKRNTMVEHSTTLHTSAELVKRRKRSRTFLALTAMTASLLVLWTPNHAVQVLAKLSNFEAPLCLIRFTWMAYPLQAIVDPLLFAVCLENVRKTCLTKMRNLFRVCQ